MVFLFVWWDDFGCTGEYEISLYVYLLIYVYVYAWGPYSVPFGILCGRVFTILWGRLSICIGMV